MKLASILLTRYMLDISLTMAVVGVMIATVINRQENLSEQMEESVVQAEAAGLRVELLDLASHREIWGGKTPEGKNPVKWAGREPVNYRGEQSEAPPERGVWYYDTSREELVYRFRNDGEARFRLAARAEDQLARAAIGSIGLLRVK